MSMYKTVKLGKDQCECGQCTKQVLKFEYKAPLYLFVGVLGLFVAIAIFIVETI